MPPDTTLQAAQPGDVRAFNQLVEQHAALVYNLAYRVLGDEHAAVEATQAAFAGARRELGARGSGSFQLSLLRCLVAACRPWLGRRPLRPASASLAGCLAALPPAQSFALALVDLAGLDYAQAAAVLGLSPGQLGCDLSAARRALSRAAAGRAG